MVNEISRNGDGGNSDTELKEFRDHNEGTNLCHLLGKLSSEIHVGYDPMHPKNSGKPLSRARNVRKEVLTLDGSNAKSDSDGGLTQMGSPLGERQSTHTGTLSKIRTSFEPTPG
jgi:hypothetical protein